MKTNWSSVKHYNEIKRNLQAKVFIFVWGWKKLIHIYCVFLATSLRTGYLLVLPLATVSTVWLLFSKDLKIFHHRRKEKILFSPLIMPALTKQGFQFEKLCVRAEFESLFWIWFGTIVRRSLLVCVFHPSDVGFNRSQICQRDSPSAQMSEVSVSASVWERTH